MQAQAFRTVVKASQPAFTIGFEDKLLSIGSCFSEHIGRKFSEHKFDIVINPFGQQYNPLSISRGLMRLLNPVDFEAKDLVLHEGLYHSMEHHGSFSRATGEETVAVINAEMKRAAVQLEQAGVLFLTFGSAHVFRYKESGEVVSNCHKIPGNRFEQELLSVQEITDCLQNTLEQLWVKLPLVKVVLTVSPVRYFAFGHYENSISKSHLFTAIHQLQRQFPQLYYFPAYEMVIDDLRDYRFYKEDMLNPNSQAIDYVWKNLTDAMLTAKAQQLIKEVTAITHAVKHRPRNPAGEAHQKFLQQTLNQIADLKSEYGLAFDEEETIIRSFLNG